jgi:hypothetical protein
MSYASVEQVREIQAAMAESGKECFPESQMDEMNVLVRLAVEFFDALQREDVVPLAGEELRYLCDSVFSGVDSFGLTASAYRSMAGNRATTLSSGAKSVESVKEEFVSKYGEFFQESDFERRCRLLLDLFKLQIIFAGLSY